MEGKMVNRFILPIFWSLLGVFIVFMIGIQMGGPVRQLVNDILGVNVIPSLFLVFGALFFLLGLALLILTVRAKLDTILKRFLLVTSSSAVGVFVSILLHGVVYGLFMLLFGEGFWGRTGISDEPFFFIMAIFVCPVGYLVGAIGSIVLMMRRRRHTATGA
jgi:hypothetical protein